MAMKLKLYNLPFGSVTINEQEVVVTVAKKEFTHTDFHYPHVEMTHILPMTQQQEHEQSIHFHYEKPPSVRSMMKVKDEDQLVKMGLVKAILEEAVAQKITHYVSLHPATLLYRPMFTVYYSYLATEGMPYEPEEMLTRYKALALFILTPQSYDTCLTKLTMLPERKQPFLASLIDADSLGEMQRLAAEAYDYMSFRQIEQVQRERKRTRRNWLLISALLIVVALAAVSYVKQQANEQQAQAVATIQQDYKEKELAKQADTAFESGDYDKATKLYLKLGESEAQIAERLIAKEAYQQALAVFPKSLEQVIEALTEREQLAQLLTLTIDEKHEELAQQLTTEKAIVAFDTTKMMADLPFVMNEPTLERMAKQYLAQKDIAGAKEVQRKTQSEALAKEIEQKEARIALKEAKATYHATEQSDATNKQELLQIQRTKIKELEEKLKEGE